jgi:hypothetical protein
MRLITGAETPQREHARRPELHGAIHGGCQKLQSIACLYAGISGIIPVAGSVGCCGRIIMVAGVGWPIVLQY